MISLEGLRVGRLKERDASQKIPEPRWYSGVEKHWCCMITWDSNGGQKARCKRPLILLV